MDEIPKRFLATELTYFSQLFRVYQCGLHGSRSEVSNSGCCIQLKDRQALSFRQPPFISILTVQESLSRRPAPNLDSWQRRRRMSHANNPSQHSMRRLLPPTTSIFFLALFAHSGPRVRNSKRKEMQRLCEQEERYVVPLV